MAIGLAALLDDIAMLAKAAASSVDDVAAAATKASSRAVAVVVDDTAVTPQYVQGLNPKRELPIIAKIAKGSLRNKAIILVLALIMSEFAPWALSPLLMIGGAYLCFEGAEKIWARLLHLEHEEAAVEQGEDAEKKIVSSAVRTDFILSTEIMVIALAEVADESVGMRAAALVVVAILITALVYGVVALIVKLDDIGLSIASREDASAFTRNLGTKIVNYTPALLRVLTVIGVAAMIWVGGHLIISGAADLGWHAPHDLVEHLSSLVPAGALAWLVETVCSLVAGFLIGSVFAGIFLAIQHLRK
ncbi:MAG: DUF808 domain-containing protein [Actinomycetaceae bacterium]|nr:DUF808 domain-containing protein [Actinomycetaceae bacterium]